MDVFLTIMMVFLFVVVVIALFVLSVTQKKVPTRDCGDVRKEIKKEVDIASCLEPVDKCLEPVDKCVDEEDECGCPCPPRKPDACSPEQLDARLRQLSLKLADKEKQIHTSRTRIMEAARIFVDPTLCDRDEQKHHIDSLQCELNVAQTDHETINAEIERIAARRVLMQQELKRQKDRYNAAVNNMFVKSAQSDVPRTPSPQHCVTSTPRAVTQLPYSLDCQDPCRTPSAVYTRVVSMLRCRPPDPLPQDPCKSSLRTRRTPDRMVSEVQVSVQRVNYSDPPGNVYMEKHTTSYEEVEDSCEEEEAEENFGDIDY